MTMLEIFWIALILIIGSLALFWPRRKYRIVRAFTEYGCQLKSTRLLRQGWQPLDVIKHDQAKKRFVIHMKRS